MKKNINEAYTVLINIEYINTKMEKMVNIVAVYTLDLYIDHTEH